ncbi:MAG TPA: 3-methyl-2-oxobutanoate hydroxymethyltransferase [Ktedonobacterales bacterium]|jgi:3-methyl-2-oxobutanoate hydroxymethyltransferase|nr:3-methyl-2-oxobutanoate hydroxymethyltransferase [Ktedonobacterales bacterium]
MAQNEKVTPATLLARKANQQPIVGLTAYDYPSALLADHAGLDFILVGDSLGPLMLGYSRVEQTTMADMIHHCAAVSRGAARALVVGDLPFGTYEVSPKQAARSAIRLTQRGGVGAVKLEGGLEVVAAVRAVAEAHIPVIGHLGMFHSGGPDASDDERRDTLVTAARALEDAGAAALVIVGLRDVHAQAVTAALTRIPTIGYQSGPHCDGQLLIGPTMLGLLPGDAPAPGPYGALGQQIQASFAQFVSDVRERRFHGDFNDSAAGTSHR